MFFRKQIYVTRAQHSCEFLLPYLYSYMIFRFYSFKNAYQLLQHPGLPLC